MNTTNQCCCLRAESQSSIRTVSHYCCLLFLGLVCIASSMFIQGASAQAPSGTLSLEGPSPDPVPDEEFEVSVEIQDPVNVSVFTIVVEYPNAIDFTSNAIEPGAGQFDVMDLTVGAETFADEEGHRVQRQLDLGINYNMGEPVFFSAGTLFTITFETSQVGNHRIAIVDSTHLQNAGGTVTDITGDDLPSVIVPVRGPMAGTVNLVPPIGDVRNGETSLIDIELKDRSRISSYEITVNPSANLGALTVSYNADDENSTAITSHTAGDPITISADLWRPNDPIDDTDWRVTHSDPIVATVFFTPTAGGEGSLEITGAKTVSTDDDTTELTLSTDDVPTKLTLSDPEPLTFTIISSERQNVVHRNTGVGPTPIIEVEDGVKNGPFEILIHFQSENYIEQQHQRLENGEVVEVIATFKFQHGVYGFKRNEIEVGGTAGASVTTRLWEADGAQLYYARINPTETGEREVTLQVPASVVHEVGTNLPNVASEIVTVSTNLEHPPWDVDENGVIQPNDVELVEAALGQGLEERGNFALYLNTITDPKGEIPDEEYRRRDVNGDLYVNQVDLDLVIEHLTGEGDRQGRGEPIRQSRDTRQARSITPPPDASVWMPDENLRRAVKEEFGIRDDSELTQARMTHLTSIGFRNNQISDITGLEYAINLTELVFRNTQISDLEPLRGLTSLEDLKLEDSNINDITPLGGLTNLTLLNISGNNISDVTVLGNLTNLTELWATDNNISDVTPLASLTQLEKLRLRGNSIFDTSPLYPLTQGAMQDVDITISQYPPASTWMPDANLRKAVRKALKIATNENFSQEQVATLTKLTAEKKRISNITGLEHATNLEKLELRRNQIVDVGPLEGLTELTELMIGHNNISDITALENLTQLMYLGLAENEISDVSTLDSLTNLKDLWLRDNNISDITALEDLTKLTRLNLEENEISDVTALESLTNLKELWIVDNNVSVVTSLGNLTKLTYLSLKENGISSITSLGNLRNLKELWMRGNNISDITALGSLTKLTHLSLRENEVSDITALGSLRNLKDLWLQENSISDVSPLSSLRKLKQLGLADNPILDTSPLYPLTRRALKRVDITVSQYPPWDVNEDGTVDATDSALVTAALGQTGNAIADPRTDVNGDDTVDQNDLTLVTDNIGTNGGAPSSVNQFTHIDKETLKNVDRETLRTYLNILRAESDGSIKYLRAIAMLEHILAATRPNQTQLLANYPNPFNPETWIPYQLANASDVKIAIYDTTGKVVRRLDLGHQPEGYYTSKVRAAYWDGRNNLGESVASGIYFYHFQADNISSLRKLLILK